MPGESHTAESSQTFHERVASTRWGSYITKMERRALQYAVEAAGKPGSSLDIGCEGGRWSKILADANWNMTCIDVDTEAISTCAQRLPDANCLCMDPDYSKLPVGDASVDLVLCIEVPPVLYADWFLPEVRRVLKPNGCCVVVFWNRGSVRGRFAAARAERRGTYNYYPQRYVDWRENAVEHGLHTEYERGFCWMPFSRSSNSPLVGPAVALEKALGLRRWTRYSPWIATVLRRT